MFLTYTQIKDMVPNEIKGRVVVDVTNKPIANAHIHVLYGSEEVVSNKQGEFTLQSWQAFPVTLVVEHNNYLSDFIKLESPKEKLNITLKPKSLV